MRVMVIVKATKDSEAGVMPSEQLMRDMGNFNEALVKAGIMLAGDGLHPSSRGVRVRFSGKDRTVVNGPFAETKELISGFWIWQVQSIEEAIEWVKRCPNPMLGPSEIEVRQIHSSEDFAASDPSGEVRAQEERLREEVGKYKLDALRFELHREFIIAGLSRNFTAETRMKIPQLWEKFVPYIGDVPGQVNQEAYGVCYGGDADGSFDYLAGVEVKNIGLLPSGFTHVRLPEQRYAVFAHPKHVSKLSETFDAIYSKWLPHSGYQSTDTPAFEKYLESFNPQTGMGGMEIWVPVEKNKE